MIRKDANFGNKWSPDLALKICKPAVIHPHHPQVKFKRYEMIKSNLSLWQLPESPGQLVEFLPTSSFWFLSHNSSYYKGNGASVVVKFWLIFRIEPCVPPYQDYHKWRSNSSYQVTHSSPRRETSGLTSTSRTIPRTETSGPTPRSHL